VSHLGGLFVTEWVCALNEPNRLKDGNYNELPEELKVEILDYVEWKAACRLVSVWKHFKSVENTLVHCPYGDGDKEIMLHHKIVEEVFESLTKTAKPLMDRAISVFTTNHPPSLSPVRLSTRTGDK